MKRIKTLFITLSGIFLLNSCLEIQETLYMKKDGSGTFKLTVDMKDMKPLLDLAKNMGSEESQDEVTADVNNTFNKFESRLQNIDGISQVKNLNDQKGLLQGIEFTFKNVATLNKALETINDNDDNNEKTKTKENYFKLEKGKLIRVSELDIKGEVEKEFGGNNVDFSINGVSMSSMLKNMSYKTRYTFEKPIKGVSNPGAVVSPDGKSVVLEYYFFDENSKAKNLNNTISFN